MNGKKLFGVICLLVLIVIVLMFAKPVMANDNCYPPTSTPRPTNTPTVTFTLTPTPTVTNTPTPTITIAPPVGFQSTPTPFVGIAPDPRNFKNSVFLPLIINQVKTSGITYP